MFILLWPRGIFLFRDWGQNLGIKLLSNKKAFQGIKSLPDAMVILTLMLKMEYSDFGVNTMPADALALKVDRASAGLV